MVRIVTGVIIALVALSIISLLHLTAVLMSYPYEWEETEGDHLNYANLILHGQSIYGDNDHFPMLFALYPPLYHYLYAGLIDLFGLHVQLGRIISLACLAIIVFLIYRIVLDESKDRRIALLASLGFLCCKMVISNLVIGRTNALYIMLVLLGCWCMVVALRSKGAKHHLFLTITSVLFFLAIYTKQLAVIPIAGAYLYLFFRQRRAAVLQFLLFLVLCAIALAYLQHQSAGWFLNNILELPKAQSNYGIRIGLSMFFFFGMLYCTLIALGAWSLWRALLGNVKGDTHRFIKMFIRNITLLDLPSIFCISGILILLMFGWNGGASADYMAPAAIGLLILAARVWRKLASKHQRIVAWAIIPMLLVQVFFLGAYGFYHVPSQESRATGDRVVQSLSAIPNPILTDRLVTYSLASGKDMLIESSVIDNLYGSKAWSSAELERSLRERRFNALFARADTPYASEPIAKVVRENYKISERFTIVTYGRVSTEYAIWVPK